MAGRVWKRGETYHIALSYKGVEYRKSALTNKKREAENLLAFYLGQCARGEFKGFQDDRIRYTVDEMLDDLLNDCIQRKLRSIKAIKSHMSPLHQAFGAVSASDLTERQIDLYVKKRFAVEIAPATLNYEMHYLQRAFKMAQHKKLVETIPHIPRFRVNNARQGFFEREDFECVVSFLPDYLQDFTRFGYMTGWRFGEIATLEWRDIQKAPFAYVLKCRRTTTDGCSLWWGHWQSWWNGDERRVSISCPCLSSPRHEDQSLL